MLKLAIFLLVIGVSYSEFHRPLKQDGLLYKRGDGVVHLVTSALYDKKHQVEKRETGQKNEGNDMDANKDKMPSRPKCKPVRSVTDASTASEPNKITVRNQPEVAAKNKTKDRKKGEKHLTLLNNFHPPQRHPSFESRRV